MPVPAQAERKLQALQGKESRLQRRLRELAQRVAALQERGQGARRLAQDAKEGAQRATAASGTLSQVSPSPAPGGFGCGMLSLTVPPCSQDLERVTQRYVLLKGRVSGLAGVSGGALQRVTQLTAEARDLLDKANSSKKKLEGEGAARGGQLPITWTPLGAHLPLHVSPRAPRIPPGTPQHASPWVRVAGRVGGVPPALCPRRLSPQSWSSTSGPTSRR